MPDEQSNLYRKKRDKRKNYFFYYDKKSGTVIIIIKKTSYILIKEKYSIFILNFITFIKSKLTIFKFGYKDKNSEN